MVESICLFIFTIYVNLVAKPFYFCNKTFHYSCPGIWSSNNEWGPTEGGRSKVKGNSGYAGGSSSGSGSCDRDGGDGGGGSRSSSSTSSSTPLFRTTC